MVNQNTKPYIQMPNGNSEWEDKKPNITTECLLILAYRFSDADYRYELLEVRSIKNRWIMYDLEGDTDKRSIEDLKADKYCTLTLLK